MVKISDENGIRRTNIKYVDIDAKDPNSRDISFNEVIKDLGQFITEKDQEERGDHEKGGHPQGEMNREGCEQKYDPVKDFNGGGVYYKKHLFSLEVIIENLL